MIGGVQRGQRHEQQGGEDAEFDGGMDTFNGVHGVGCLFG
jgi:hypothetical protein